MKRINGQLPTWYIVKRISADEDLYAKAPDTHTLYPCVASYDGMHMKFETQFPEDEDGALSGDAPIRDDWTLYRHKPKPVAVGDVKKTRHGVEWTTKTGDALKELPDGVYTITATRVKS